MSDATSLTTLLSELRERFAPGADPREVEVWLASRGYDSRQIGEILAVFAPHLAGASDDAGEPRASPAGGTGRPEGPLFRVPGTHERGRFTPEAWGRILALSAAGVLSPTDREQLIDRALQNTDGRVGLAEVRALLAGTGIDDEPAASTIH